jgi:hypothetical protein
MDPEKSWSQVEEILKLLTNGMRFLSTEELTV